MGSGELQTRSAAVLKYLTWMGHYAICVLYALPLLVTHSGSMSQNAPWGIC